MRSIWDLSTGCTCTLKLMFTLRLEPSTIRFKHHRVIHLATDSS
ncbi:unnamed protein product [Schistosoma margrebowiei]|uniref:Uncharacterized protein n=1 Tax=Schistosoma margrebowiei TaxID=48269 RepID=A0A3P8F867_9TREM|nr:unnamed protein product [Schistosoma margrebowiei]